MAQIFDTNLFMCHYSPTSNNTINNKETPRCSNAAENMRHAQCRCNNRCKEHCLNPTAALRGARAVYTAGVSVSENEHTVYKRRYSLMLTHQLSVAQSRFSEITAGANRRIKYLKERSESIEQQQ